MLYQVKWNPNVYSIYDECALPGIFIQPNNFSMTFLKNIFDMERTKFMFNMLIRVAPDYFTLPRPTIVYIYLFLKIWKPLI